MQSLIARTWFVDGEVFILKTKGSSLPRIQLIHKELWIYVIGLARFQIRNAASVDAPVEILVYEPIGKDP